jgi:hypothetical protein
MIIFRCTQKFAKKFKVKPERDISEVSTTVLGDWYFNYFTNQRKHYLLGVSENTLLPVIITAGGLKDFPERFLRQLAEILQNIGIDQPKIDRELAEMQTIIWGVTVSRVILGCQNDYIRNIAYILRDDSLSNLADLSLLLARTPFRSIGFASPREVCSKAFGQK